MSLGNIQYRRCGRISDIVSFRRIWLRIFAIGASFLLLLWQAPPSFSESNLIVINEIFPSSNNDEEWIEIFNTSALEQPLGGLKIGDEETKGGGEGMYLFPEGAKIPGDGYQIIAKKATAFKAKYGFNPSYEFVASDDSVPDMIKYTSWASGSLALSSDDEVVLLGDLDEVIEKVVVESVSSDKSYGFDGAAWKEANPTPGVENSFPEEGTKDQQEEQQPQPTITFSSPSTVSVGTAFSISATLKNFKPGTYSLKVLIGKGDKFYDGRTKGTDGKWLAWNAGWADFPKMTVGASGSGNKTVQAKTDGDIVAGNYLIKVRAYNGKNTFDSDTKSLKVTGLVASESSGSAAGDSSGSAGEEPSFTEATEGAGEVLGEEQPRDEKSKLNFYAILGIFGTVVGSGGFMLAFRRGVQRSQTPDTPEQESTPLSERSCTPNG